VALWAGAAWFADAGRLWRWDHDGRQSIAAPVAVAAVGAFGGELLIETAHGRYRAGTDGSWEAWPVNASRLVATGDDRLPVLALWDDGAATLHDPAGRESVALRLPVPARDVSAAVLRGGQIYLATAGYGLLSSNLLWVGDDSRARVERPDALSSR
jgi:hypothetical protein